MPLYSFYCKSCGTLFERILHIAERNEPQECPFCEHGKHHKSGKRLIDKPNIDPFIFEHTIDGTKRGD